MEVLVTVWGKRSGLEGGQDIAEKNDILEYAGSSEVVGEAQESDVTEVRGDGGSFEKCGELGEVDLNKVEKAVDSGGRGTVVDDFAADKLHDGCLEGEARFFTEGRDHSMSKGGKSERKLGKTG